MSTDPSAEIREFFQTIADLKSRFQRWQEEHSKEIAVLVRYLQSAILEYQRYHNEQEAEDFATLAKGGWIGLERNFDYSGIMVAAKIYRVRGEDAMNNEVSAYFNRDDCAALANIVENWNRVPYLKNRDAIIRDAFSAHKAGQFTLSIPALLPLAEGLAADAVGDHSTQAVHLAAKKWKDSETEAWALEFFNVVDQVVYKPYAFGKDTATFLNRHGILHGRVLDYATAANSTRVFLLIDAIVGIWEGKQKTAASAGTNSI